MKAKDLFSVFTIVTALLFVIANGVSADTNVSGFISADTTWTKANSPYVATGSIIINSGITLTIEPGVTVKLNSSKAIQVDGTLIAKGTNANKITFTRDSSASSNWGHILFSDSSTDASYDDSGNYTSGSILEYCVVEYAGGTSVSYGAVRTDNAHPFINYCTIQNNTATGIYAYNLSSTLKITNCNISNNTYSSSNSSYYGAGIYTYNGTVIISNNTVSNNTGYYGGGIYTYSGTVTISNNIISNNIGTYGGGGIYTNYSTITISNNFISNNVSTYGGGGGIYVYSGTVTISGNIISNNIVTGADYYYGGGIYAYYSTVTISNNIISNNAAPSSYIGGLCAYYSTVIISKNSITGNSAKSYSAIQYYYYYYSDNKDFQYNTITSNKATDSSKTLTVYIYSTPVFNYNNIFGNTATYELWNANGASSSHLDAKNNWWGTTVDSGIQDKIYDYIDDASVGIVDYSPYATAIHTDCPISPPTGLTSTAGNDNIALSWTANSESDTKGYKVYWDTDSGHSYANSVDAGKVTSYTITGLAAGKYYVTVTAYDTSYNSTADDTSTIVNDNQTNGNESWYADEATVTVGSTATPTPALTPSPLPTLPPLPTPTLQPLPTPTPPPLPGGRIFGFVNDEDENALKGVTVAIKGDTSSNSTETDDAGYYEFRDLAAGNYALTYEKDSYQTQAQVVSIGDGEVKPLGTITMELVTIGKISGNVVDIKGGPIESVKLTLKGIKTKIKKADSSDADGFFAFTDLDADTYVIIAKKKGYKSAKKSITLEKEEEKEIEIEMRKTSKRIGITIED